MKKFNPKIYSTHYLTLIEKSFNSRLIDKFILALSKKKWDLLEELLHDQGLYLGHSKNVFLETLTNAFAQWPNPKFVEFSFGIDREKYPGAEVLIISLQFEPRTFVKLNTKRIEGRILTPSKDCELKFGISLRFDNCYINRISLTKNVEENCVIDPYRLGECKN